jgi:hypothetical protein
MTERTPIREMEHYLLVNILAEKLRKGGFSEIEADHLQSSSPPHAVLDEDGCAFTPDLVACKDGKKWIFEVETDDSLLSEKTEQEIRAFYHYAKEVGGEFCILVPEKCTNKADYLLDWMKLPDVGILYS